MKEKTRDNISFKETANTVRTTVKDFILYLKEWITDYGKILLPGILLAAIMVTFLLALSARNKVEAAKLLTEEAVTEAKTEVVEATNTDFEVNAYPEINQLISEYYEAIKKVDTEKLEEIQGNISETEELRLRAMSPYIDRYDNICVYTKPGPYENTYIVYATVDVYLKEAEPSTPGLQAFYVCMTEHGTYYINTGVLSEEEAAYIEAVAGQADVINLKNTVNVTYNELLEEDTVLKDYWAQISVEIDSSIGKELTEEAAYQAQLEEEARLKEEEERKNDPDYQEEVPEVIKVKVNTLVNVRKSASATADKVGTASVGSVYEVLQVMDNGWTRIDYDGTEAYIKTEFLDEVIDISGIVSIGKITANDMLNVRSEPNQNAEKLGVLSSGEVVDLIEEVDDWSKIKYNGQIGYVKTEYTTKN